MVRRSVRQQETRVRRWQLRDIVRGLIRDIVRGLFAPGEQQLIVFVKRRQQGRVRGLAPTSSIRRSDNDGGRI